MNDGKVLHCYIPIKCSSNDIHGLPPRFSITTANATQKSDRVSSTKDMRFNFRSKINGRFITCCHIQWCCCNFFQKLIILHSQPKLFTVNKHENLNFFIHSCIYNPILAHQIKFVESTHLETGQDYA